MESYIFAIIEGKQLLQELAFVTKMANDSHSKGLKL